MVALRTFAALGHVWRADPCVEYPGAWLVFVNGGEPTSFATLAEAKRAALLAWDEAIGDVEVCVGWRASEGDPRVGEVWFAGFYIHGRVDCFGRYRGT